MEYLPTNQQQRARLLTISYASALGVPVLPSVDSFPPTVRLSSINAYTGVMNAVAAADASGLWGDQRSAVIQGLTVSDGAISSYQHIHTQTRPKP